FPCSTQRPDRSGGNRLAPQPALHVLRPRLGAGVALARLLIQALQTDRFQIAVGARLDGVWPRRLSLDDLQQGRHRRFAPKWRPAGEKLIQDGAETVDVGRGRNTLTPN